MRDDRELAIKQFGDDLAELRVSVGKPSFARIEQLSRSSGGVHGSARGRRLLPRVTAWEATQGGRLPSMAVVTAFVVACRRAAIENEVVLDEDVFDVTVWHKRWREIAALPVPGDPIGESTTVPADDVDSANQAFRGARLSNDSALCRAYVWEVSFDGDVVKSGSGRLGEYDEYMEETYDTYHEFAVDLLADECKQLVADHQYDAMLARLDGVPEPSLIEAVSVCVRDGHGVQKAALAVSLSPLPITGQELNRFAAYMQRETEREAQTLVQRAASYGEIAKMRSEL